MIDRNIFTETKRPLSDTLIDIAFSVALGIALCMLVLHGLDALFI